MIKGISKMILSGFCSKQYSNNTFRRSPEEKVCNDRFSALEISRLAGAPFLYIEQWSNQKTERRYSYLKRLRRHDARWID